jgi:RNA polymerase sigma factor (sigma-70 family)
VRTARSDMNMEDLARRMCELDELAFQEFSDHFSFRFRSLFFRRGLLFSDAQDLAASCVTDIALKVEQYHPVAGGSFEAWVFTLARRALTDWWRARRVTESLSEDFPSDLPFDDEPDQESELTSAVRDALARLPEADRAVIETKNFMGEQTFAEAGATLGLSAGAARVRYHRALKRLQALLEKDSRIVRHLDRRSIMNREAAHE